MLNCVWFVGLIKHVKRNVTGSSEKHHELVDDVTKGEGGLGNKNDQSSIAK